MNHSGGICEQEILSAILSELFYGDRGPSKCFPSLIFLLYLSQLSLVYH